MKFIRNRRRLPKVGAILQGAQGEIFVVVRKSFLKGHFTMQSVRTESTYLMPGWLGGKEAPLNIPKFLDLIDRCGWKSGGQWQTATCSQTLKIKRKKNEK